MRVAGLEMASLKAWGCLRRLTIVPDAQSPGSNEWGAPRRRPPEPALTWRCASIQSPWAEMSGERADPKLFESSRPARFLVAAGSRLRKDAGHFRGATVKSDRIELLQGTRWSEKKIQLFS